MGTQEDRSSPAESTLSTLGPLPDARARGAADATAFRADPEAISGTPLGDFGAGGPGEAALRRLAHAVHLPPTAIQFGCRLLPRRPRGRAMAALERYGYWHGARACLDRQTWSRLTRGTAILMYHAVGLPSERPSHFVVPARRFERQLRWLARQRRPVIGLDDLADHRREGRLPPAGSVVVTFDDGYADTLEVAAPLLRRYGFPATVFAVSGRIGAVADWDGAEELSGRRLLDSAGLAALSDSGLAVGAHTRTHPRLPELDVRDAFVEIEQSRNELAEHVDRPIRSFAYPYGRTNDEIVAQVGQAGYEVACGIERGLTYANTPLLRMRRVPVDGNASVFRFALGVRLGDPDLALAPFRVLRRVALVAVQRIGRGSRG